MLQGWKNKGFNESARRPANPNLIVNIVVWSTATRVQTTNAACAETNISTEHRHTCSC